MSLTLPLWLSLVRPLLLSYKRNMMRLPYDGGGQEEELITNPRRWGFRGNPNYRYHEAHLLPLFNTELSDASIHPTYFFCQEQHQRQQQRGHSHNFYFGRAYLPWGNDTFFLMGNDEVENISRPLDGQGITQKWSSSIFAFSTAAKTPFTIYLIRFATLIPIPSSFGSLARSKLL
jgi:hypothetical protein